MQFWENFLKQQARTLGHEVVQKWLKPLKIVRYDAQNLYLEAKDTFQALWFEEHIRSKAQSLKNNNNRKIKVHLSIANQKPLPPQKKEQPPEPTDPPFQITFETLDPYSTFAHLTVHQENLLAHKLFCHTAGYDPTYHKLIPGQTELAQCNPIYLYGPPGTGKTHSMMALAHALSDRGLMVRYCRAETFTEHVVSAIRAGEMRAFRQAYRNSDALIVDDVTFFSRKRATQEEFFHTFNALHMSGKQIVISANCAPSELKHIEPRLISRFEWGIVLPLKPPDKLAFKEIIKKRALSLKFPLSLRVIEFLTATFPHDPRGATRALEALILRSHLQHISSHSFHSEQLTIPQAKQLLTDLIQEKEQELLTSSKILLSTSQHFDLEIEEITGKSRQRAYVLARQLAMYLCRHQLKMSYVKIADLFERDHSTVMASVKNIQKGLNQNHSEIVSAYNVIRKKIT